MRCRELPICHTRDSCSLCITFIFALTYRWDKLKNAHELVTKHLSGTWWGARAEATRAVMSHYKEIRTALLAIRADQDQILETTVEADGLANKMGN